MNPLDQAFPRSGHDGSTEIDTPHDGMSVRDFLACQAMAAYIIANPSGNNALTQAQIASNSYSMADFQITQSNL